MSGVEDLRSIVRQGYAEALEIAEDQVLEGDINNVLQLLSAIGVKSLTHIRDVDPEDLKDSLKTLPNKVAKGKILSKLAQKAPSQAPQPGPSSASSQAPQAGLGIGTPTYETIEMKIEEMLWPKLQDIKPDKTIEITQFFNTHADHPLHTVIKNLKIPLSRQGTPDFLMFNLPQEAHKAPPLDYHSSISIELPNSALNETSHKLFEHLRQSDNISSNALFATMIGVSGCGKTRTMYEYLCCRFGLYFVADTQGNGGSADAMAARTMIEDAFETSAISRSPHDIINALLLARICVFCICLKHRPSMTPYEWLLIQTSLWTKELNQAFRIATTLSSDTSETAIQSFLTTFQHQHSYCLPVFLDEAQLFMQSCVGKFLSKQEGVRRPLFSKICSTFGFFSGMLTIIGGTGLGLKDVRELLLSQIGKDSWHDVHFIDFAPFDTILEVLKYFVTFVGADNITEKITVILSEFYLARRRWVPELLRQMLLCQCPATTTVEELVCSSHASLLDTERSSNAPVTTIRGKLEQLKRSPAGAALLPQLRDLAAGYYYLGATPADENQSELVQEGFCHLTSTNPLEVQIYEQRVAYALYYFFEDQGQPVINKVIDLIGVAHKIDPSAAGFVFERFIAPKVVAWLKSSSKLADHPYFNQCRDSLPAWSFEAVVDTTDPTRIEIARTTGKSLPEYCLSDSTAVFIPAHSHRHDLVFRLRLADGSQVFVFCQWKFRKGMQKSHIAAALRSTVPEEVIQEYSDRKRKRDPDTDPYKKYQMRNKYLRILCTFPCELKDEDLPGVCEDGNTIFMMLDRRRACDLMSKQEWNTLFLVK